MRQYRLVRLLASSVTLILVCAALLAAAANATPAPTGARISIFGGTSQTYPAGQPFYFRHGWLNAPSFDGGIGLWSFSLSVDGVEQHGFLQTIVTQDFPGIGTVLFRPYLFNFPDGMTGTHVFAGTFSGPCGPMVAGGFATGPCAAPNAIVPETGNPFTTTVTFVP